MPKIEIDSNEFYNLQDMLVEYKKENDELKKRLEESEMDLNKPLLRDKAIRLSYKLFESYIRCVFKELGFNVSSYGAVHYNGDFNTPNYKFPETENIEITLNANVSKHFKSAFLNIGVLPENKTNKEEKDPLEL